jgi:release factor glutamine methyltransferase
MNTRNLRFRSNRVADICALYHADLDPLYGRGEVDVFLSMLFEYFLGWDRVALLLGRANTVDQSDLLRFHWALEDLRRHRPIQHIIGHVDFCGCRIAVGPEALIPRPETEEMVSTLSGGLRPPLNILDLCTGSGCIAIALKKAFPEAQVTAVDLSTPALDLARSNAAANNTDIRFLEADILSPAFSLSPSTFHLITANPPYVRQSERALMQPNVLDHEPAMALFVPDDDPLLFYRAIARIAHQCLAPDGLLALEINETLAPETVSLLAAHGLAATTHTDFRGKPRWLTATRPHPQPQLLP